MQTALRTLSSTFSRNAKALCLRINHKISSFAASMGANLTTDNGEIKFGDPCHVEKSPAIRGIYQGPAEWAGSGCAEIKVKGNSAALTSTDSVIVKLSDLRPGLASVVQAAAPAPVSAAATPRQPAPQAQPKSRPQAVFA